VKSAYRRFIKMIGRNMVAAGHYYRALSLHVYNTGFTVWRTGVTVLNVYNVVWFIVFSRDVHVVN